MFRRSFSTVKTAGEFLAASRANTFITSNIEPIIREQCENGFQFARFTSSRYCQLWDKNMTEGIVQSLKEKGYNVTHDVYKFTPLEQLIRDNTIYKEDTEVVLYVDWRTGV